MAAEVALVAVKDIGVRARMNVFVAADVYVAKDPKSREGHLHVVTRTHQ